MADETDQLAVEPEAPEVPDFIDENFRTAADPVAEQAKAYAEARREMARVQTRADQQQREFTEALQALAEEQRQPAPQTYAPQTDPLLQAAQRAYEEGDVTTLLAIQAQISQAATAQILDQRLSQLDERFNGVTAQDRELSLRMAEEQVQRVFGDRWQELAPKVQEQLQTRPLPDTPSVEGYADHILTLAKIVDYDRVTQANATLEQERQAKLNAQTLDGGSARVQLTATKDEDAWNEIRNADAGGWNKVIGNG